MRPRISIPPGSVRKICQLTGEHDFQTGGKAFNETQTRFQLYGTDLGSSFEHDGVLWFLFGDTWTVPHATDHLDSVAFTTAPDPEPGIRLEFIHGGGRYRPPRLLDGLGQALTTTEYEVPIAGFSARGQMYVFHSTDRMTEDGVAGGLDAVWIRPDRGVGATTWANPAVDGGRWHDPFPITPPGAAAEVSPLDAVTRLDGLLDVFFLGPDRAVVTVWSNPEVDGGRWQDPFPITPPADPAPPPGAAHARAARRADPPQRPAGQDILMGRTVLAIAANNDPTDLHALYDFSVLSQGGKFLNVACVVREAGLPDLPFGGPALLAWGSGRYRESDVYFGAAPLDAVEDPAAWIYFGGSGPSPWTADQRAAASLFHQPQVGELSVAWIEPLGLWLMLYNTGSPRGINARVAASAWGPWSDPVLIFDPGWPGLGYALYPCGQQRRRPVRSRPGARMGRRVRALPHRPLHAADQPLPWGAGPGAGGLRHVGLEPLQHRAHDGDGAAGARHRLTREEQ